MNLTYVTSWAIAMAVVEEHYFQAICKTRWADPLQFPAETWIRHGMKREEVLDSRKRQIAEAHGHLESMMDILLDAGTSNMWEVTKSETADL